MKKICLILILYLLVVFYATDVSYAIDDQINVTASVPLEDSGSTGGGAVHIYDTTPPQIFDVKVSEISFYSVMISWQTTENASAYLHYGKTLSYEIENFQLHPESITSLHKIKLENLEKGTKYYFQINSLDSAGNQSIKDGYEFETLSEIQIISDVSSFTAKSQVEKIVLDWENPQDNNFSGVQINRSVDFPSLSPQEGDVIYSSDGNHFDDVNIEDGIKYFYTAYSYDDSGNFSSGTFVWAFVNFEDKPIPPKPPIIIPPDVENFEIIVEGKKFVVSWKNPLNENFKEIEVYKSENFPAFNPGEGELIYKGKDIYFEDQEIKEEMIYYYTIFAKDKDGNYSLGKTESGTLKKVKPALIEKISIDDASFIIQDKALLLPFDENNRIHVFPENEIGLYYNSENLPKTLKTILLTIGRSSYILKPDGKKEFYRTKFISPSNPGSYKMTISVLDFKNGKIFQTKAVLVVDDYGEATGRPSDLDLVILRIKNYIGISAQERHLLQNAKITLYEFDDDENWIMWGSEKFNQKNPQITNSNGNFGFMVPNGKYKITVEKDNYISKSEIIEVENNIINNKIEIKEKNNWLVLIIVIVILFSGLIIRKKLKKIKEKKRE
ncbi:MAG: fibronectin type III domain-containing protein [Patescibacteria group bacterium]|nr:fibronectin type III domain-containing protein [Patescibacteria group bacterium]